MNNLTLAESAACLDFYSPNNDIVGIGSRVSTYILAIISVVISQRAKGYLFVLTIAMTPLFVSIALNVVLIIDRSLGRISPKNMDTAYSVSYTAWTAATYAFASLFCRCDEMSNVEDRREFKIAAAAVWLPSFILTIIAGAMCEVFWNWRSSPLLHCGRTEVIGPTSWCPPITWVIFGISVVACSSPLVSSYLERKPLAKKWSKWVRQADRFLIGSFLIMSVVVEEVALKANVGVDIDYSENAGNWGEGQLIAMIMLTAQFWEILKHAVRRQNK